jgi:biopolymer transport protein ExbB
MQLLQVLTNGVTSPDSISVATAPVTSHQTLTFFQLAIKGGIVLIPITLLAIMAVYIILERLFYIKRISRINLRQIDNIRNLVVSGKLDSAMAICRSEDTSIFRLFEIGLKRIGQPIKDIESYIETANLIEVTRMSRGLGWLGITAGIAPMLGFIGTIIGIIHIFYGISLADNISIGVISTGLYQKMISSLSGLLVGVVAYAGYHYLNILIDKFTSRAEIEMFSFINLLQEPINETETK